MVKIIDDELENALQHIESMKFKTLDAAMDQWQEMILSLKPYGNPYAFKFHKDTNVKFPFSITVNRDELFDQEAREKDAVRACSKMVQSPDWQEFSKTLKQSMKGVELKQAFDKYLKEKRKLDKSIDAFLTIEEKRTILEYILDEVKRYNTIDNETKKQIPKQKSISLEKWMNQKRAGFNLVLDVPIPNMGVTYRKRIDEQEIKCPINVFFVTLENILRENYINNDHQQILNYLARDLKECGADCPCPARIK